ncbi:hypothetical protein [Ureibacillus aquaedulcis]|uniref:Uncharacterized protein n=1 Tax=Ureibacillus aquaedulcis TaxID=3058421 RepID=A0ABT8GNT7_9BACL|nr:hypothetical protein [Ureibacillus sp. BA0131]MDN4493086.1 hypothetical protein [Ureibacillus sp. BA0131]
MDKYNLYGFFFLFGIKIIIHANNIENISGGGILVLVTHYGLINWTESNKEYYKSLGYNYTNLGDCFEVAKQHLTHDQSIHPKLYPTKWIGRKEYNNYYIEKGYTFTKTKDEFLVSPCDLLPNSRIKVLCICDLCNKAFKCGHYLHYQRKINNKPDACDKCKLTEKVNCIDYLNKLKKAYDEGIFVIEGDSITVKVMSGYVKMTPNRNKQIYLPSLNKSRISKEILLFISKLEIEVITEEVLAIYWYENKLPNVKMNGFWSLVQCKACIRLIKGKGESLSTLNIRKKYNDLYTAITHQMSYYNFLLFCGEDPTDYYYGFETTEDRRLLGIYVEHSIRKMIKDHSNYFEFQKKDRNNRLDIVNKIDKSVTEFKLSINTKLNKEKTKYKEYNLCIIFLMGEETFIEVTPEGFKKMSIFQWIDLNEEYLINKDLLIGKMREFKTIILDPITVSKEIHNYYSKLCAKVFDLSKNGESQEAISKKLDLSRRQIGRILNNQTLKAYVDNNLSIDYKELKKKERDKKDVRNKVIIELYNNGIKIREIQKQLSERYGSISIYRIEQIIYKSKVNKGTNKGEIIATDLDGNVLGIFSTSVEAARELNLPSHRNICTVLRSEKRHYKKIKFSYA